MKETKFRVHCALAECYYYLKEKDNPLTGETNLIFCTYPERDLTSAGPCPYYRMDWQKKMKLVQEKIQANKEARLKAQSQSPPQSVSPSPATSAPQSESPINPVSEPQPPITPPDILFEQDNKLNPQEEISQEEQHDKASDSTPSPSPSK
jgi:hypothetical protein